MTLMTDAVAHAPARESVDRPRHPLHLGRTVGMLRRGGTDPTMVIDGARIWMTFRTDAGIDGAQPLVAAQHQTGSREQHE